MREKTYRQRVEDFVAIITHLDSNQTFKIVPEDEYHSARLRTAHFGGNILGSRRIFLSDQETPLRTADEAKNILLTGLEPTDINKLPYRQAWEYRTIIQLIAESDLDDLETVNKLNKYLGNFSRRKPVFYEDSQ
jgi:hypothetical protein